MVLSFPRHDFASRCGLVRLFPGAWGRLWSRPDREPPAPCPVSLTTGSCLWRANQFQPRRAADHVGHLFPLSWSRQERAHGRYAAGSPRRSAEADPVGPRANRARRSGQERDHRAHLGERAAGDAARIGPQGADGETEGDTSALGGRRRRLRRAIGRINRSRVLPCRTHPIRPARKTRSTTSFNTAWASTG
jgi:hypothetical protein